MRKSNFALRLQPSLLDEAARYLGKPEGLPQGWRGADPNRPLI
jgi:hypothetical protein